MTRGAVVASAAAGKSASKTVHLVRHGQTHMNVFLSKVPYGSPGFRDPLDFDTRLTHVGKEGAKAAAARCRQLAPQPEVLVVSPLSRAVETAMLAFPHHRGPVELHPLARERVWLSSDMGRAPHELEKEFGPLAADLGWGALDTSAITEEVWYYTGEGGHRSPELEPEEVFATRVDEFKAYLQSRPERSIAVVAHWGLIHQLTGGASFDNCEVRSYELFSDGRLRQIPPLVSAAASGASWLSSLLDRP